MGMQMIRQSRQFSLACLKQQFGHLSPDEFARKLAQAWLQEDYSEGFVTKGSDVTWIQDSGSIITIIHQVLTELNIPYYITGGMAAIAYGEPRTTRDVDMVLSISLSEINALVQQLEQKGFYIPGVDDVKSGRMKTLSITHIESISRADLVLSGNDEFDRVKFERKRLVDVLSAGPAYIASPEDVILNKLRWRLQSQSEKQWRDVLGVLKVQGDALDFEYLNYWAEQLGLVEDLAMAMEQSGF